jgi:hypothetical protein
MSDAQGCEALNCFATLAMMEKGDPGERQYASEAGGRRLERFAKRSSARANCSEERPGEYLSTTIILGSGRLQYYDVLVKFRR